MPAPKEIQTLVERFQQSIEAYTSGEYNETQLRREFLDPLFNALGWDIDNKQGYAEAYKDVVHEDSIKIGTATKAPDYSFRIGGTRKFFVEAKKPSTDVKEEVGPAFQLRRYAWSAKLPLSILSDFEEFAVYDCRIKPRPSDKSSVGRVLYFKYSEYVEKWDEIASIFSREAVLKGSFDKYVESTRGKKGTAEVDDAFLNEIEVWRELLAKNIASEKPKLSVRDLNFAVQRTIDRIIFLRICEDRGIETYGTLLGLVNGSRIYKRLCDIFYRADEKYNSGLFHFQKEKDRAEPPDEFTLGLEIDDGPLKEIIKGLYYPDSSYEFSVLPADILGQVYEQFLGKIIRLTAGHQAKVEDKPEVKKAGGVYYTPTYIVNYIVKNTVGKLLEELGSKEKSADKKTIKSASKLRILDPACGSGSFLIGAYQYLLDWHRDWYINDGSKKWAIGKNPTLYQAQGGEWRLTAAERKRILLNNIYGVDIDPQAVEVTKLSLLLKVLEGENEQTISRQLKMFHQRALPDLANNIKCGNSLIGPDFYEGRQLSLMDDEERTRINAFDWSTEFKELMVAGGFNAVIGNPPYIRIQLMKEWAPLEVEAYKRLYTSASSGNYDIYVVFAEKGLKLLNKHGYLGFILPHKFFNSQYGEPLRLLIAAGKHLAHIVHFGDEQVFHGATTYTCLLFLDKGGVKETRIVKVVDIDAWRTTGDGDKGAVDIENFTAREWNLAVGESGNVFQKLSQMPITLGSISDRIAQGIRTSANEVYVLDMIEGNDKQATVYSKQLQKNVKLERQGVSMFLQGRDIRRYYIVPSSKVVIIPYTVLKGKNVLIPEVELRTGLPKTFSYLLDNKSYLEKRERSRMKGPNWYAYVYPKNIELMHSAKILVPDIADKASFALDEIGEFAFTSGYGLTLKRSLSESPKYVLGLLNSKVLDFFLKKVSTNLRGGFFRYFTQFIEQLPIRTIDFSDPTDKSRHDRMVSLVETMLDLHKRLATAKIEHDQTPIKRQIEATDRQIDDLVYQLYGLTDEEKRIVEGN